MPRGIYTRKQTDKNSSAKPVYVRADQSQATGHTNNKPSALSMVSLEPAVPVVHIERGSSGEYRYGIRTPGLTTAQAREDAQREFEALEQFVRNLKTA